MSQVGINRVNRVVLVVLIFCCFTAYNIFCSKCSLLESSMILYCLNHLTNLWTFVCPFYMMLTEFFENLKVVSFDFSMIKNIIAPSFLSNLQIKLIWFIFQTISFNTCCIQLNCTLALQHLNFLHCWLIHYWSMICNQ